MVQSSSNQLQLEIEAAPLLSLAMFENAIPVVSRVSITNRTSSNLENLTVEIALLPDLSQKWSAHISSIPADGTFSLRDIELTLDRDKLVNQVERSAGELVVWVRQQGADLPLATEQHRIDVLAYNEWVHGGIPQLLAAFVLPNHPVIAELLAEARAPLAELTGDPALDGYQSGSPRRVAAMAEAVYRTIQAKGITYSNPPASFERTGQKIRTPEQILEQHVATCMDISTLTAAALEQMGLNAAIVLLKGHAFPGVWLDKNVASDGVIDDVAAARKLLALGRLLVFDSSAAVARPVKAFAEARRIGEQYLSGDDFLIMLDVAGAREQKYRPLPARTGPGYATVVEIQVPAPQSGPAGVPVATSPDSSGARSKGSGRARHPRVDAWKQRLLDTTLRNRLLNFRDTKQSLELLFDDLAHVEDALAASRDLSIRGRPQMLGDEDPRSKKLLDARLADDTGKTFLRDRLARGEMFAKLPAEGTDGRLLQIYRAAREALEETGTNMLCLAIGMLHWFESDSSEEARRSPILLVPVTLQRNSKGNGYTLRSSGEDAKLNVTLFEKMRIDRGVTIPELAELPVDESGVDVRAILNRVRESVLHLRRWEVRDELHLGLFSFAKFQMWADLDQNLEVLLQNPVIDHLLNGNRNTFPNQGPFTEARELDAKFSPKDLLCPLDADASQLAAVAAAADGRTFVLQGPPGTGKSQTITNLVTHCIAQGKRVLFVAEKAAALEVVQRRLAQVGMAPYVLELHSHKSGKIQVLEQFKDALEATPVSPAATWEQDASRLQAERARLNAYVEAMHRKHRSGFSMFEALGHLDRLRETPLLNLPAACAEPEEHREHLLEKVGELQEAISKLGSIARCAWQGCQIPAWRVDLPSQVSEAVGEALRHLEAADRSGAALAEALGANQPSTLDDLDALCAVATALADAPPHGPALTSSTDFGRAEQDALALARTVRSRSEALTRIRQTYAEGLYQLDIKALAERFRKYARSFVLFAWWGLRSARKTIQAVVRSGQLPSRQQIATDLEQALEVAQQEQTIASQLARGRELYGAAWRAEESDPTQLDAALNWARECQRAVSAARPGLLGSSLPANTGAQAIAFEGRRHLDALRQALAAVHKLIGRQQTPPRADRNEWEETRTLLSRWRDNVHQLRPWHTYLTASKTLEKAGCGPLVEAAASGSLTHEQLVPAFTKGVYQAWARRTLGQDPTLSEFDGDAHSKCVSTFGDLDRKLLTMSQSTARAKVAQRAPTSSAPAGGEVGVLLKELQKKRGHMPIRKLLAQIPAAAARLKPCFLMSPMSVATYLDPKAPPFDLIVFDEASQIPAHDAIGAIARGRSAVVVGDTRQLPPTSFFQSGGDDDAPDENDFEELESILNECIANGIPERRLDWHYRSRHESLIAFSNHAYYQNKLNTFPSSEERGEGRGITLKRIDGFYDRGGSRTNRAEADALVRDLVARLKAPDAAKRSYGVVTFSMAQQELVEDLLEAVRAKDPQLEPFFNPEINPEHVIVKNLENIQGDERDVMLFSICYGPDPTGKLSMSFGPLNLDGGERRLNVAVTRAREELVVYSTLRPEHIDLTRTKARGVKDLKTFLDYAERGPRAIAEALTIADEDQFDSPFEEQVCARLRALGFTVHTQVGCAGYRLDLGLCHPEEKGRYVLAVECDGAHYHSARSARERDRLRAQVLAGLGWRIHRIWSTDWWQNADREIQKIKVAFELACTQPREQRIPVAAPVLELAAPSPAASGSVISIDSARRSTPVPASSVPTDSQPVALYARAAQSGPTIHVYEVATIPASSRGPDDVHDDRFREETKRVLLEIVKVEAPLSVRTLSKRVAPYFQIQRVSTRLDERVAQILRGAAKVQKEIIWRLDQDPATYTEFRQSNGQRDAEQVAEEEIANAAASVLRGSISLDHDELVKLTARALGYSRTGERVADQMAAGIKLLIRRGRARRAGDKVEVM